MNAKEYYNDFVGRYEIQKKYANKDKRELLFEVIEGYAKHKEKNLLKKYIEHINECEGSDFIDIGSTVDFKPEELVELTSLSNSR